MNQFTAVATLSPSSQDNIQVQLTPNAAGTRSLSAIADYYFENDLTDNERNEESLSVTAVEAIDDGEIGSNVSSDDDEYNETETDDRTRGFGRGSTLATLGGIGYVLKRRENDSG